MPYAKYITEEDLRKKNQIDPNALAASPQSAGYVAPSPMGSSPAGPSTAPAPRAGTGWTNLEKYLTANQGKGQQSAEALFSAGENKIAGTTAPLKAAVEKGTIQKNEELERQLKNEAENVDKSQFKGYVESTYSGPKTADDVKDYKGILNQYTSASRDLENLQNRDQRASLFEKNLNDSNYSPGMGALDNFLLNTEGEPYLNERITARKADPRTQKALDDQLKDWAADASFRSRQNTKGAWDTASSTRKGLYDKNQAEFSAYESMGKAKKLGDVLDYSDRNKMAALSQMLGEENLFKDADLDPPTPPPMTPQGPPPAIGDLLGGYGRPGIDDLHMPGAVGGMTGTPGPLPSSPGSDLSPIVSGAPVVLPPPKPSPLPDLSPKPSPLPMPKTGPIVTPFPVQPTGPIDPYRQLMMKYGGRFM